MLAKRIIPCLDVKNGRVVKGVRFLHLRDAGDPVTIAQTYNRTGADELVFLDITATIENRKTILKVVERTAEKVFIPLTVGGGIRNLTDIRDLLHAGADKVSLNTAAVKNPGLIARAADKFGSQCIVIAVDMRRVSAHRQLPLNYAGIQSVRGEVYINAGRTATGIDVISWVRKVTQFGAGEILLTSMDADGTEQGYDLNLTRQVVETVNVPVIASGGAGKLTHLYDVLKYGKADAVLAASIFHYGEYCVKQVKRYLSQRGIPIRLG